MSTSGAEVVAARLCEELKRFDAEATVAVAPSSGRQGVLGLIARAAEYGIDLDLMERLDARDFAWVFPLRHDGEWAVVTYHYDSGWSYVAGENIPAWLAAQLPA